MTEAMLAHTNEASVAWCDVSASHRATSSRYGETTVYETKQTISAIIFVAIVDSGPYCCIGLALASSTPFCTDHYYLMLIVVFKLRLTVGIQTNGLSKILNIVRLLGSG